MDGLSRPERKAYPGINEHGRLAGGPAETAGSPPGQGRQDPRYRPERRTITVYGLGGLFPGELLQATVTERSAWPTPYRPWGAPSPKSTPWKFRASPRPRS